MPYKLPIYIVTKIDNKSNIDFDFLKKDVFMYCNASEAYQKCKELNQELKQQLYFVINESIEDPSISTCY